MTTASRASRLLSLFRSSLKTLFAIALAAALASCGGGSGSADPGNPAPARPQIVDNSVAPADNVVRVTVDRGKDGSGPLNIPYVAVTVCRPGTNVCVTLDHVLVDTGSNGLRLSASAVGSALALPVVVDAAGAQVGECSQFATGFVWGAVRRADVKLAGEIAAGLAIQVVNDADPSYATVPTDCTGSGANLGVGAGANGILGIGTLVQDCGTLCTISTAPGIYFACNLSGCAPTRVPLASQVANPVAAFSRDNNGVALVLPAVPPGGAGSLLGSLVFGIDTQANNQLGAASVFQTDRQGNFKTTFQGVSYTSSFIDSGSNAIFFADAGLPVCSGFYCPAAPLSLTAVNTSATGVSQTVTFTVENISSFGSNVAAAHAAGDIGLPGSFDWGLPFFFGRKVFVAISGASTSKGTGPFWAY